MPYCEAHILLTCQGKFVTIQLFPSTKSCPLVSLQHRAFPNPNPTLDIKAYKESKTVYIKT